ncbi:hypothetical protein BH10CYA1_BH10CYA1_52760 [soil metagenome]
MAKSKSTKLQGNSSVWKSRNRCLIILPDQGAPRKVSLQQLGIESRDRSWNAHADNFLRANDAYLRALDIELVFSSTPNELQMSLKPNGVVGAVPLKAPDTHRIIGGIIVSPRFGWNSIGSLFSSIGWSASPEILSNPLVPGSATEIPGWVVAGPAVAQLESLLKYSGPRFREITDVRSSPRGQIVWPKYCSNQVARGNLHLLPCVFSDLDVDYQLRRYIRWTLEKIGNDLSIFCTADFFAAQLFARVQALLMTLTSIQPLLPDHRSLDSMERTMRQRLPNKNLGFDSIRWILDERGLGGNTDLDGLSWRIRMHELFEQWVESLVRKWARGFGGKVTTGRKFDSLAAIRWDRAGVKSLSSLIPDVVVQGANETFIFDAKYKGFLDEVDELRWRESSELMRDEHRHDIHQVLAYSSLYNCTNVTAVLVYPVSFSTWERLLEKNGVVSLGTVDGPGRQIRVALVGVPIELKNGVTPSSIVESFQRLRE